MRNGKSKDTKSCVACSVFKRVIDNSGQDASAVFPKQTWTKNRKWNVKIADVRDAPVETELVILLVKLH